MGREDARIDSPARNTGDGALTQRRKIEHIEICMQENVQSRCGTMFEHIQFIHRSLPEVDRSSIDLTTNFLGLRANAPIMIAAMTGGHPQTYDVNRRLAEAAEELRIPIGVGSQRAAVEDKSLAYTFRVVRDSAPSVPVVANIGATHIEFAQAAIDMIDADVLAVHLNPLQEAIQPEGDCNSVGVLDSIRELRENVEIPIIVKETGAGMSASVARQLEEIDIDAVDVGGVGGTSWAAVEYYRALREGDQVRAMLGEQYWDWGIPTALSVITVREATDLPVIATGGIRSGLDVAKALSLGAMVAGIALPLLKPAVTGETEDVIDVLNGMIEGLKTAMYLTGCERVDDLQMQPLLLSPTLVTTLQALDIDFRKFTRGRRLHRLR
ncbi:MAG: type 2 isopentenyl-diphosphate Delta-isomerase [Candidatus Thorarchaeota archaeon]